jgi:hypothetical protein
LISANAGGLAQDAVNARPLIGLPSGGPGGLPRRAIQAAFISDSVEGWPYRGLVIALATPHLDATAKISTPSLGWIAAPQTL